MAGTGAELHFLDSESGNENHARTADPADRAETAGSAGTVRPAEVTDGIAALLRAPAAAL